MKYSYPRFRPARPAILAAVVLSVALASCGGGGGSSGGSNQSAGVGGTGISYGTVTGFGSLLLNGRRVEDSGAFVTLDDIPGSGLNGGIK